MLFVIVHEMKIERREKKIRPRSTNSLLSFQYKMEIHSNKSSYALVNSFCLFERMLLFANR